MDDCAGEHGCARSGRGIGFPWSSMSMTFCEPGAAVKRFDDVHAYVMWIYGWHGVALGMGMIPRSRGTTVLMSNALFYTRPRAVFRYFQPSGTALSRRSTTG